MIFAKIFYKIYNIKLLAIIEVFKNCTYNLKDYQFKTLILTNYNKLYYLINIRNLNFY